MSMHTVAIALVRIRDSVRGLTARSAARKAWQKPPRRGPWTIGERLSYVLFAVEQCAAVWRERRSSEAPENEVPTLRDRLRFRMMSATFRLPDEARIPAALWPANALSPEEIEVRISAAVLDLATLNEAIAAAGAESFRARHRDLGPLTFAEWIRFLLIHTLHHVRRAADAVP